jgi:hypothetical protein
LIHSRSTCGFLQGTAVIFLSSAQRTEAAALFTNLKSIIDLSV